MLSTISYLKNVNPGLEAIFYTRIFLVSLGIMQYVVFFYGDEGFYWKLPWLLVTTKGGLIHSIGAANTQ